eukprot:6464541-Amphidinium_carterae.1
MWAPRAGRERQIEKKTGTTPPPSRSARSHCHNRHTVLLGEGCDALAGRKWRTAAAVAAAASCAASHVWLHRWGKLQGGVSH